MSDEKREGMREGMASLGVGRGLLVQIHRSGDRKRQITPIAKLIHHFQGIVPALTHVDFK
jgi:hypothetical protein